jgi:hypothetical protein
MKCKSCQGEVPPKFTHAILMNMCPLCGEVIMDEELQVSLKALKEAMNAVKAYPAEIFDWLKSNFNLVTQEELNAKVKEAEEKVLRSRPAAPVSAKIIAEKTEEVQLDGDGNQISGPSLQQADQTNKFFKNAEANKVLDKQAHFKSIIKQIKKSGGTSIDDGEGGGGAITPEIMGMSAEDVDPVELADLRAAFGDTSEDIHSGLDPSDIDYEDDIPSVVMNMANKASGGTGVNQRDLLKLQNLKSASAKSQIAKTGSVGLIRR